MLDVPRHNQLMPADVRVNRSALSPAGGVALRLLFLVVGLICLVSEVRGDGPDDNVPGKVRPIPPVGEAIGQAAAEALSWRCEAIRSQWDTVLQRASDEATAAAGKKPSPAAVATLARLTSLTPEVLVFPRAVELALEFQQFYKPNTAEQASQLLDEATRRIELATRGGTWADLVGLGDGSEMQLIVGGYRSKIDGSYQPYGLVVPAGMARGDARPRRLDLWFHGRGETLSEVAFLQTQQKSPGRYTPADTFVLHPYGRYSNAFKFAGEIDVLEALAYVQSRLPVDPDRISVRGFSMGGAACWQMATHYADRWFAANPGAGFSETPEFLRFFQGEDVRETAPPYQQRLWQLYDCPPWAANLSHCPTVAYSGEIDRQKQAADVMQETLAKLGVDLVHVIGPQTGHSIHPDSKREIESRMATLARSATSAVPHNVTLRTVTLRYHTMHWVDVQGLESHWTPASVEASIVRESTIRVSTENVSELRLSFDSGQWPGSPSGNITLNIDGQSLTGPPVRSDRSWDWVMAKSDGKWQGGVARQGLHKRPGLQGPIDDALMDSFLFVLPSGQSDDADVRRWVEAESRHAMLHWRKHFRGDIRSVLDSELTDQQIANNHLIVFGDDASNLVIRAILPKLPIGWDKESIRIGEAEVPRAGHLPLLVQPNPLNPDRYVVLNSGFTFREYDYLNNARQTPKLPDWALVDVRDGATYQSPGVVKAAGFFDETWQP